MFTIILTILFISALIIAHEFGHLIVAKLFNISVQEFSIGFPPRIWSKKIGETKYSVNALLFGGFVKLAGETHSAAIALSDEEQKRSFSSQPFWKKAAVVIGGVATNFIAGWFIFSILFLQGVPQRVGISEVLRIQPRN